MSSKKSVSKKVSSADSKLEEVDIEIHAPEMKELNEANDEDDANSDVFIQTQVTRERRDSDKNDSSQSSVESASVSAVDEYIRSVMTPRTGITQLNSTMSIQKDAQVAEEKAMNDIEPGEHQGGKGYSADGDKICQTKKDEGCGTKSSADSNRKAHEGSTIDQSEIHSPDGNSERGGTAGHGNNCETSRQNNPGNDNKLGNEKVANQNTKVLVPAYNPCTGDGSSDKGCCSFGGSGKRARSDKELIEIETSDKRQRQGNLNETPERIGEATGQSTSHEANNRRETTNSSAANEDKGQDILNSLISMQVNRIINHQLQFLFNRTMALPVKRPGGYILQPPTFENLSSMPFPPADCGQDPYKPHLTSETVFAFHKFVSTLMWDYSEHIAYYGSPDRNNANTNHLETFNAFSEFCSKLLKDVNDSAADFMNKNR